MKLLQKQFQYVFNANMRFKLNLTKITEMADVLKNRFKNFDIMQGLILHFYS